MKARFSSKCPGCGERIAAGSQISKRGARYVCANCAAPSAFGHAPGCDGGCDGGCGEPPAPEDVITIRTSGGEFYRNARGRCEDAPCCGCCTI